MAANVTVEHAGETHPLMDQANAIGDPPDESEQSRTRQPSGGFLIEQDEQGRTREVANPDSGREGDFERFLASFGSPKRWAGAN